MCPPFLTERGFILANAISRKGKYTGLCQYSLSVFEAIFCQFICFTHGSDHFVSIPKLLPIQTAEAATLRCSSEKVF